MKERELLNEKLKNARELALKAEESITNIIETIEKLD